MKINYIYEISIKKRIEYQSQLKNDYLRKCVLTNNIIREILYLREHAKKEEQKWFNTCLNNLEQLKL